MRDIRPIACKPDTLSALWLGGGTCSCENCCSCASDSVIDARHNVRSPNLANVLSTAKRSDRTNAAARPFGFGHEHLPLGWQGGGTAAELRARRRWGWAAIQAMPNAK